MLKSRGEPTTPARASESTAVLNVDPGGMVTRTEPPVEDPPHAAATARIAALPSPVTRCLTRKRERMLQEHGSRKGIDIALSATS